MNNEDLNKIVKDMYGEYEGKTVTRPLVLRFVIELVNKMHAIDSSLEPGEAYFIAEQAVEQLVGGVE